MKYTAGTRPPQAKPAPTIERALQPKPLSHATQEPTASAGVGHHLASFAIEASEATLQRVVDPNAVIQRAKLGDIKTMRAAIAEALNAGEEAAAGKGSRLLSSNAKNITELGKLFTMPTEKVETEKARATTLKRQSQNKYYEGRNDNILKRLARGAQELMEAVIFWGKDLDTRDHRITTPSVIELMGSDLHEKGLGAAKVTYLRNDPEAVALYDLPTIKMVVMIKPEDRSIEQALLGTENSLASNLNQHLPTTKKVSTVNMDVDKQHGTISEYVQSGLHEAATWALRKVGAFYSADENATETIALAFLGGIWDLHNENVITRGGKPVLVDADVALRPTEFINGPDNQQAFSRPLGLSDKLTGNKDQHRLTTAVKGQLNGEAAHKGKSILLQYAIDHPEEVIKILVEVIGDKEARALPLLTADLVHGRRMYETLESEGDKHAVEELSMLADGVEKGGKDFFGELKGKGFEGELGVDKGNCWDKAFVMKNLKADFDSAQLPVFSYQPASGRAFYHGKTVWVGYSIKDSMGALHKRLTQAKKNL